MIKESCNMIAQDLTAFKQVVVSGASSPYLHAKKIQDFKWFLPETVMNKEKDPSDRSWLIFSLFVGPPLLYGSYSIQNLAMFG